jgi:hypothetical protein
MKISFLIGILQQHLENHGDLEVTCKETLSPTTTDNRKIMRGEPFETTADTVLYTECTEAFPEPHFRITL